VVQQDRLSVTSGQLTTQHDHITSSYFPSQTQSVSSVSLPRLFISTTLIAISLYLSRSGDWQ